MALLLLTAQLGLVGATWLVVRGRTRARTRLAAVTATLCLMPLMMLGAIWPSLHTLLALAALPALVGWLAALARPGLLVRSFWRSYCIAALALAPTATAVQIWWRAR